MPKNLVELRFYDFVCTLCLTGEFGTVIVHGGFEMDKTANQTPVSSTKEPSAAHENVESHPVGGPGIKSTNNWYFSSTVLLLFTWMQMSYF